MATILDVLSSRRSFLACACAATAVALVAPRKLFAQDDGLVQTARRTAGASNVTVQKLRGNVSVLLGAGGNIAVLTGRDGKLLIDAGFAGARPKITEALASISSDPIKHLINTHWHFDHTDGNEWLHSAGAAFFAAPKRVVHHREGGTSVYFPSRTAEMFITRTARPRKTSNRAGFQDPSSPISVANINGSRLCVSD